MTNRDMGFIVSLGLRVIIGSFNMNNFSSSPKNKVFQFAKKLVPLDILFPIIRVYVMS